MASEVDIANLALSHLGDSATVASLDPPEGSAQAEHCARWYAFARNALLEMHDWKFNTARVKLAQVEQNWTEWGYAYAQPSDCLKVIAILPDGATGDYTTGYEHTSVSAYSQIGDYAGRVSIYTAQPFTVESDENGQIVIYTNQIDAVLRYTRVVTDTSKFSPLFVMTLARLLASYLAGPVLKGDTGMAIGEKQLGLAMAMLSKAGVADANQMRQPIEQSVPWLAGR